MLGMKKPGGRDLASCNCALGRGTHFEVIAMPENGDTTTDVRQQVVFETDDLDFARGIVDIFGARHLLSIARYSRDGQSHVEVAGPMPRDWHNMIPARARRQGTPRLGWRNSRGRQLLHAVTFAQLAELAAELAEQRGARRAV